MSYAIQTALIRFAKSAVAVIIAGLASVYGDSAYYMALAPLLLAVDKYVREHFKTEV